MSQVPRTSREAAKRPQAWTPPNKLDTPEPPEGFEYRWVRHELLGEDQASNVYSRNRQGYEPVNINDPEFQGYQADSMPSDSKRSGVVRAGDLILMKVPKEVVNQRNSYFSEQARSMQAAVDGERNRQQSDKMPILDESRSKVSRGGGNTRFED
jgi:hypothetical protein